MALKQRRMKVTGGARATVDHDEIMSWAEEKGARPVMVRGTGILRLDFPGLSGSDAFEAISWDEFFEKFEQSELAFLYQDTTGTRRNSTFNKLVHRKTGEAHGERREPRAPRAPSPSAVSTRSTRSTRKKSSPTRKAGTPARSRARTSSRAASPSQGAAQRRRTRPARGAPGRARATRTSRVRSAAPPARTTAPKQLSRKAPSKKRGRTSAKSRSR